MKLPWESQSSQYMNFAVTSASASETNLTRTLHWIRRNAEVESFSS